MVNTKISALTSATPVATDELAIVDSPAACPTSKRVTVGSVLDIINGDVAVDSAGASVIGAGSVDIAMLSNNVDGRMITWDACSEPTLVATGDSGEVLTSNGLGSAPSFQAASGVEVPVWTQTHDANGNDFILDADGDTLIEEISDDIIRFTFPTDSTTAGFRFGNEDGYMQIREDAVCAGHFSPELSFKLAGSINSKVRIVAQVDPTFDCCTDAAMIFEAEQDDGTDIVARDLFRWRNNQTIVTDVSFCGNWCFKANDITTTGSLASTNATFTGCDACDFPAIQINSNHWGSLVAHTAATGSSQVELFTSGGTIASPTATTSGRVLGNFTFGGYDTDWTSSGLVRGRASELWAAGSRGTEIEFVTVPNTTTTQTVNLTVGQDGTTDFEGNKFTNFAGTTITCLSTVTGISGDFVMISDTSDSGNIKKVDAVNFIGGGSIRKERFKMTGMVPEGTVAYPDVHTLTTQGSQISGFVYPCNAADGVVNYKVRVPTNLAATPNLKVIFKAMTLAVDSPSANSRWLLSGKGLADTCNADVAFDTAETVVTEAMEVTTETYSEVSITISNITLAANDIAHFQLSRDTSSACDTFAGDILVPELYLEADVSGGVSTYTDMIKATMTVPEGTIAYPDVHTLGTAVAKVSGFVMPNGATLSTINAKVKVPPNINATANAKIVTTIMTLGAVAGPADVRLRVSSNVRGDGQSLDFALANECEVTVTMPTATETLDFYEQDLGTDPVADDEMIIQLRRDPADCADDFTDDIMVVDVYLKIDRDTV